jgi:hypothetical protein
MFGHGSRTLDDRQFWDVEETRRTGLVLDGVAAFETLRL